MKKIVLALSLFAATASAQIATKPITEVGIPTELQAMPTTGYFGTPLKFRIKLTTTKPGPKPGKLRNPKKRLARATIENRIRELLRRGDEDSKAEAARLAMGLMPFEEPRLAAVMAQTEHKVTYVARLPSPIQDIEEWQQQTANLLLPPK